MTNQKFNQLAELGAGEFEHLDGTLTEHLLGTKQLLQQWGASSVLQDAGLYHAAYGTAGFDENFVGTDQRNTIAVIIGKEAEEIVYQYCACDREYYFTRIGVEDNPLFKNRFTGEHYHLPFAMVKNFCELTAANETEIAIDNPAFIAEHGKGISKLLAQMTPYLSVNAISKYQEVFDNYDLNIQDN